MHKVKQSEQIVVLAAGLHVFENNLKFFSCPQQSAHAGFHTVVLLLLLLFYACCTRLKLTHRPWSSDVGRMRDTRSYCRRIKAHKASRRPLIGVYHLFSGGWLGAGFGVGRLIIGSSTSCGMDTLAFFAFSSRAPSSVEPFSPQRTSIRLIPPTPLPP